MSIAPTQQEVDQATWQSVALGRRFWKNSCRLARLILGIESFPRPLAKSSTRSGIMMIGSKKRGFFTPIFGDSWRNGEPGAFEALLDMTSWSKLLKAKSTGIRASRLD